MSLVNTKRMLEQAFENNYAVGAFNINNMEILQAVINSAQKNNSDVILQVSKNSFITETKSSLYRYKFFIYVLIEPYFKLLMAALFFDILFNLSSFLLKKYFFKLNKENQQNILTKSVKENMTSNIIVELFFTIMIKGLALGFGIFYLLSASKEIDKIKGVKRIKKNFWKIINHIFLN